MRYYCITMNMPSAVQYIIAIYVIAVACTGCSGLVFWETMSSDVMLRFLVRTQMSRDVSAVQCAGQRNYARRRGLPWYQMSARIRYIRAQSSDVRGGVCVDYFY